MYIFNHLTKHLRLFTFIYLSTSATNQSLCDHTFTCSWRLSCLFTCSNLLLFSSKQYVRLSSFPIRMVIIHVQLRNKSFAKKRNFIKQKTIQFYCRRCWLKRIWALFVVRTPVQTLAPRTTLSLARTLCVNTTL